MRLLLNIPELDSILRVFLINLTFNTCMLYVLFTIFPKRRYTGFMICFAIFRLVVDFFLTNIYVYTPNMSPILHLASIFILTVTFYIVLAIVFRYPSLLIWISMTCIDLIVGYLGLGCLLIINIIEGRRPFTVYRAPFMLPDLLILVLTPCCVILATHIAKNHLRKLGHYYLKHPRLVAAVLIAYAFFAFVSRASVDLVAILSICLIVILFASIFVFLLLGPTQLNLSKAQSRQEYLRSQQKLMESYLTTIQRQILNIQQTQHLIDSQMEKITQQDTVAPNTDLFSSYLEELQKHYAASKLNTYSDNWMIDAALSSHAELFKEKKIHFHCSLVDYHAGTIEEWHLVEFLIFLLDYGIQLNASVAPEERKLSITIATVRNTLTISFSSSWDGKSMISKRSFQKYLKHYHSDIQIEKEKTTLQIAFSLLEEQ